MKYDLFHTARSGFSLTELLITMTIFVTLSVVLLVNYNTVSVRMALDNEAQEVALWVREAQAYATGVRAQGGTLYATYGIYVDSTTPDRFVMFVDKFDAMGNFSTPNRRYDANASVCGSVGSECLKTVILPAGIRLSAITVANPLPPTATQSVHIAYTRPNPDALITDTLGAISGQASVQIISPKGNTRTILVMNSGQIAVQ